MFSIKNRSFRSLGAISVSAAVACSSPPQESTGSAEAAATSEQYGLVPIWQGSSIRANTGNQPGVSFLNTRVEYDMFGDVTTTTKYAAGLQTLNVGVTNEFDDFDGGGNHFKTNFAAMSFNRNYIRVLTDSVSIHCESNDYCEASKTFDLVARHLDTSSKAWLRGKKATVVLNGFTIDNASNETRSLWFDGIKIDFHDGTPDDGSLEVRARFDALGSTASIGWDGSASGGSDYTLSYAAPNFDATAHFAIFVYDEAKASVTEKAISTGYNENGGVKYGADDVDVQTTLTTTLSGVQPASKDNIMVGLGRFGFLNTSGSDFYRIRGLVQATSWLSSRLSVTSAGEVAYDDGADILYTQFAPTIRVLACADSTVCQVQQADYSADATGIYGSVPTQIWAGAGNTPKPR